MGLKIWEFIKKFFVPYGTSDNFGAADKLSGFVLFAIWVLRFSTGWKIIVHCALDTTGHSENSEHYKGNAIDFHFVTDVAFYAQVVKVEKLLLAWQFFNFVGLGIYPDWNNPGFHLDTRGKKARWGFLNKQVGSQVVAEMVSYNRAKGTAKKRMEESDV